jgi:hypothetical protein
MDKQRKITVHIPKDLLHKAQQSTGKGITETIRQGLSLIAAGRAYEELRKLRGKVKFGVSLGKIRDDRE